MWTNFIIIQIICTKVRERDQRIVRLKEGDPTGRHVVIVDDLVQSGGTLIECQVYILFWRPLCCILQLWTSRRKIWSILLRIYIDLIFGHVCRNSWHIMERLKSVLMSLMVSSLISHGKNLTVIMEVNFFSSTTVILQFVTLSIKQLHLTNDSISYFQLTVGLSAFLLGNPYW